MTSRQNILTNFCELTCIFASLDTFPCDSILDSIRLYYQMKYYSIIIVVILFFCFWFRPQTKVTSFDNIVSLNENQYFLFRFNITGVALFSPPFSRKNPQMFYRQIYNSPINCSQCTWWMYVRGFVVWCTSQSVWNRICVQNWNMQLIKSSNGLTRFCRIRSTKYPQSYPNWSKIQIKHVTTTTQIIKQPNHMHTQRQTTKDEKKNQRF